MQRMGTIFNNFEILEKAERILSLLSIISLVHNRTHDFLFVSPLFGAMEAGHGGRRRIVRDIQRDKRQIHINRTKFWGRRGRREETYSLSDMSKRAFVLPMSFCDLKNSHDVHEFRSLSVDFFTISTASVKVAEDARSKMSCVQLWPGLYIPLA